MLKYTSLQLIKLGDTVRIHSLTNAVQYNDKEGHIIKIGNGDKSRLTIALNSQVLPAGSTVAKVRVRPTNLIFICRSTSTTSAPSTTHQEEEQQTVDPIVDILYTKAKEIIRQDRKLRKPFRSTCLYEFITKVVSEMQRICISCSKNEYKKQVLRIVMNRMVDESKVPNKKQTKKTVDKIVDGLYEIVKSFVDGEYEEVEILQPDDKVKRTLGVRVQEPGPHGEYFVPHVDQWTALPSRMMEIPDLPIPFEWPGLKSLKERIERKDNTGLQFSRDCKDHEHPSNPIFAIEIPGEPFVAPNLTFMEYGNYYGANILTKTTNFHESIQIRNIFHDLCNDENEATFIKIMTELPDLNVEDARHALFIQIIKERRMSGTIAYEDAEHASFWYTSLSNVAHQWMENLKLPDQALNEIAFEEIGTNKESTIIIYGAIGIPVQYETLPPVPEKNRLLPESPPYNFDTTYNRLEEPTEHRPTFVVIRPRNGGLHWMYWGTNGKVYNHAEYADDDRLAESGLFAFDCARRRVPKLKTQNTNDKDHWHLEVLNVFRAMIECGDTAGCVTVSAWGKFSAQSFGKYIEYADLLDRMVELVVRRRGPKLEALKPCPGFDHPYWAQHIIFHALYAGEAHEAAVEVLSKANNKQEMLKEMQRAILSYKFGAYNGSRKGLLEKGWINRNTLGMMWCCLAVCQRRYIGLAFDPEENLAMFEMTERSYRWGMAVSSQLTDPRDNQSIFESCQTNFDHCIKMKKAGEKANRKYTKKYMKKQKKGAYNDSCYITAADGTKSPNIFSTEMCGYCASKVRKNEDGTVQKTQKLKLLKCSRCRLVSYCSSLCQKAAWKRHKKSCSSSVK